MYGYLRWRKTTRRKDGLTNTYRCYYCGLCNAMKKNYGLRSLVFLSNDMTLILIAISECIGKCTNIPDCCLSKRNSKIDGVYSEQWWKQIAAVSIGIAYAKALDDWLDEKTMAAGARYAIVKILARKVYKKQEGLLKTLKESIQNIKNAEEKGCGLGEQSSLTANMLCAAIQYGNIVCLDEASCSYITALAKWLCLIDAIDDYNKDGKKGKYNPFFNDSYQISNEEGMTNKQVFLAKYYCEIAEVYRNILFDMRKSLAEMKLNGNEKEIIFCMTYEKMPNIFNEVLQRKD